MGPGAYDVDRATNLTKTKTASVNMGSSPGRPAQVGQTDVPVARGTFNNMS